MADKRYINCLRSRGGDGKEKPEKLSAKRGGGGA